MFYTVKINFFRIAIAAGLCFICAAPSSFVFASIDTDAYERIMGSSPKKNPDAKKSPSVEGLPTPPIKKASASSVSSKSAVPKKSAAASSIPVSSKREGSGGGNTEDDYVLQIGDVLTVKIYPEDEYIKGGQMEVSSEGNITLPLVGKFEIAGKNVIEAEKALVEVIDRDYLVNPEVVIQVEQHKKQSIVILGQVRKPGPYELPAGSSKLTLLQAIALAGGFTEVANIKKIKIVRQTDGDSKILSANADAIISGKDQDIDLESGDAVNVSESLF